MNKMILLDYSFLFNPDATWGHLSQFESDLADFFSSYGMQAEVVENMKGQPGRRILLIKRVDKMMTAGNNPPPHTPQDQLKKLQSPFQNQNEQKKGQFIARKGYLKR